MCVAGVRQGDGRLVAVREGRYRELSGDEPEVLPLLARKGVQMLG